MLTIYVDVAFSKTPCQQYMLTAIFDFGGCSQDVYTPYVYLNARKRCGARRIFFRLSMASEKDDLKIML